MPDIGLVGNAIAGGLLGIGLIFLIWRGLKAGAKAEHEAANAKAREQTGVEVDKGQAQVDAACEKELNRKDRTPDAEWN